MQQIKILAVVGCLFLTACAAKPASQTIATNGIQQANALIDYAQHHLPATTENQLLINGIQTCRDNLAHTAAACETEKEPLRDKIAYWRLIAGGLGALVLLLIYSKIKSIFKKIAAWII